MVTFPRLASSFRAAIGKEEIFLLNEQHKFYSLKGALYQEIIPFLIGEEALSVDEIIDRTPTLSAAEVYFALIEMEEKGLVEERGILDENVSAFAQLLQVPSSQAIHRLNQVTFSLHAVGDAKIDLLEKAMDALSLKTASHADIDVVVTDHYRREELQAFHKASLKKKKPWILAKLKGFDIWLGPLFIPKKTGCYACLLKRIEQNQVEERWMEKKVKQKGPVFTSFPDLTSNIAIGAHLLAIELLKWALTEKNEKLEGKVLSYNALDTTFEEHQLIQQPYCKACAKGKRVEEELPFLPESQPIVFSSDGGFRTRLPEEVFMKYRHHISPITGVLKHFTERTVADSLVKIYCTSCSMRCFEKAKISGLRITGIGKGLSEHQMKASCLGEGLERYSSEFFEHKTVKKASFSELGEDAVDLRKCLLFSERQYARREKINQKKHKFQYVPLPFDEKEKIDWVPIWSMTYSRWKWIPAAYSVYTKGKGKKSFCKGDSNGCASGSTREEAFLQGFLELIERDSIAIWWYNRLKVAEVDLDSFENPQLSSLISSYKSKGREVWALDITTDLQIPSFVALSRNVCGKKEKILMGFGAHFDPKIALFRAVTEMGQMFLSAEKEDLEDSEIKEWFAKTSLQSDSYLSPDPHRAKTVYTLREDFLFQDLKTGIDLCTQLMRDKGLETLAFDLTRKDIDFPVMRVVVPGLRHFWTRFAPGRLYDVPVEMGFLKEKTREDDLNPIAMFL